MSGLGKGLIGLGLTLAALGAIIYLVPMPSGKGGFLGLPLGRLPGDFVYEKNGTRVYIPLMTCFLISAVFALFRALAGMLFKD